MTVACAVAVTGVPEAFSSLAYARTFGIPIPVVIALAVLAICIVVLRYTKLGRRIYATGGNEEAARLSGIAIGAVKVAAQIAKKRDECLA